VDEGEKRGSEGERDGGDEASLCFLGEVEGCERGSVWVMRRVRMCMCGCGGGLV